MGAKRWELQAPRLHSCEPAWKWNPSKGLTDYDFWLVLQGRGRMRLGGEDFDLETGRWFLLQPGDGPDASHDPANPLVVFACHFLPAGEVRRLHRGVISGICREPLRQSAELAAQVFPEGPTGRELAAATLRQILWQAAHSLTGKAGGSVHSRLDALAMEIRSAPGRSWTMAEMARKSALSLPHLNRLWRAAWGLAPRQFVIRERVLRAVMLLRESDMTIQQIAESLGYNDVFFFHRQFRRTAGVTPRAVRLGAKTRLDAGEDARAIGPEKL
ncbi:MAG: helix-turn-helix domain-containing protein [Terrimicrobiaceae bacterium]